MRIDKYLKVSRILKRRSIGKDLAQNQRVLLNGRAAKPASEVKTGDIVEIVFGNRHLEVKVLDTAAFSKKADAKMMYEVIREFREE